MSEYRTGGTGLYRKEFEKDSCGIGFIAHLDGKKTHSLVEDSLRMLRNMEHRGGCGCDENTGDGAGILVQIPDEFFRSELAREGIMLPPAGTYGAGVIYLPREEVKNYVARMIIDQVAMRLNFEILAYRDVPVNREGVGETALEEEPLLRQIFLIPRFETSGPDELERKLFVFRNYCTHQILEKVNSARNDFYFSSLSCKTIIYKGQLTTYQLATYYTDLQNKIFISGLALIHSRFSTNTLPSWKLAQPFRYLAHNGEINTIKGNLNWMKSKETLLESSLFTKKELEMILPICDPEDSDSASLDNVIELLYLGGRSLPHAMMMVIPEAWQGDHEMSDFKKAFYEYHDCLMEPWDGPASICFTDGHIVGATLDRNGLRPSRYIVTSDHRLIMASEAGVLDTDPSIIVQKGRLQPGKMFIADLDKGIIISDEEIKGELCSAKPYREWLTRQKISFNDLPQVERDHLHQGDNDPADTIDLNLGINDPLELLRQQIAFGVSQEEVDLILKPMMNEGKEPVGSMGTDAPLAVLSELPQNLANYFKQLFAQVTNPPIDPIREKMVMSNYSILGGYGGILTSSEEHCKQIQISEPVLTHEDIAKLRYIRHPDYKIITIHTLFAARSTKGGLQRALDRICREALEAVVNGNNIIILSDKGVDKDNAAVPTLLATGAVHNYLVAKKVRINTSMVIESGDIREVHHFAAHIAYGASAIYPYLAFQTIAALVAGHTAGQMPEEALLKQKISNYRSAVASGLLKIYSKMGISTFSSYHGSQKFEILGLNNDVVNKCFTGTVSRIGGMGFDEIGREALIKHNTAFPDHENSASLNGVTEAGSGRKIAYGVSAKGIRLDEGGFYQWRRRGEEHLFNPDTIHLLQFSTATNNYGVFKKYSEKMDRRQDKVITLRHLIDFNSAKNKPVELSEVESVATICRRFVTGAMSFGSISHEAHTTLAIAMNRMGAKSNSGEGGEDEARYKRKANGDWERSAIKQVASARFGVTSNYLANAQELQIKMAQGAKPGEGGQLPGDKVDAEIARVRHSTPGVGLISPPPHHDIYSIEDLAQLIFDLKNSNPAARVSVKLVSEAGVGTIAAGVAKAKADMVLISGFDGGTGASPISSIRHAGLPWELGLAETHQTLVRNKLRNRITVQVDGQLRTGKDLAIATLLGAEEWGAATAALVAAGCIMMRKCHLNTCPVGIATQDEELRQNFTGKPDQVINFFKFLAEELREIMAVLGFKTVNEMVGQAHMLKTNPRTEHWKYGTLDLDDILYYAPGASDTMYKTTSQDHKIDAVLDRELIRRSKQALENGTPVHAAFPIANTDRATGTMLSYEISTRYGRKGLDQGTIHFSFRGSAGQSFGAFAAKGLRLDLEGEANDYLAKGLSGAIITLYPPREAVFKAQENIIAGNVALYGATSGEVYIRGVAGERFCVRNSGANAVVEGVGDHGCEYMTGGTVVVIGKTGRNFAAGMSGGIAYVFDPDHEFKSMCNTEMVDLDPLEIADQQRVMELLGKHAYYTGSLLATQLLNTWDIAGAHFIKVMPRDYKAVLNQIAAIPVSFNLTELQETINNGENNRI